MKHTVVEFHLYRLEEMSVANLHQLKKCNMSLLYKLNKVLMPAGKVGLKATNDDPGLETVALTKRTQLTSITCLVSVSVCV